MNLIPLTTVMLSYAACPAPKTRRQKGVCLNRLSFQLAWPAILLSLGRSHAWPLFTPLLALYPPLRWCSEWATTVLLRSITLAAAVGALGWRDANLVPLLVWLVFVQGFVASD